MVSNGTVRCQISPLGVCLVVSIIVLAGRLIQGMDEGGRDQTFRQALSRLGADVTADQADLAPPCFRRFAEGLQDTGNAAADDEDADQVIRLGKQGGHETAGFRGIFVGRTTVVDGKVAGVLTDVRSKAGIRNVLTLVPVVADEDRYPPRRMGGPGDEPGRGPPELPVVGADVAGPVRTRLIRAPG